MDKKLDERLKQLEQMHKNAAREYNVKRVNELLEVYNVAPTYEERSTLEYFCGRGMDVEWMIRHIRDGTSLLMAVVAYHNY